MPVAVSDSNAVRPVPDQHSVPPTAAGVARYIPAFDGIRGILVLLVVLTHLDLVAFGAGFIAVNSFFVLSGFLITTILLAEWNRTRSLDLKKFYVRRVLRLFPALFAMLALFALYSWLTHPPEIRARDDRDIAEALFYATNWADIRWLGQRGNLLGHTWSLSIEEQFYLLWPGILFLLLRKCKTPVSLLSWTLLAAALSEFIRVLSVAWDQPFWSSFWRLSRGLDTRADCLLYGCAAAILLTTGLLQLTPRLRTFLGLASWMSLGGLAVISCVNQFQDGMYCLGWLLASLFAAIILVDVTLVPQSVLQRLLQFRPLMYLGRISYGLYVWHFPIIQILNRRHSHHWKILGFTGALTVAIISYFAIERPCLRLKNRFQPVKD